MKLITLFFPVTKLFTAAIEKYMADKAIKEKESPTLGFLQSRYLKVQRSGEGVPRGICSNKEILGRTMNYLFVSIFGRANMM